MITRAIATIFLAMLLVVPARAGSAQGGSAKDAEFAAALSKAAGKLAPTKSLVERGASLDVALDEACFYGEIDTARYLLEKGANVNARDSSSGWTPLLYALSAHHLASPALIQLLIDKGADVNAADKNGNTPLSKAAYFKEATDQVKLLIANGAHVNTEMKYPLETAIGWGNYDTARLLVEAGANVNKWNGTPLLYRAALNGHKGMARFLVEHGADPNAPDADGSRTLSLAYNDPETTKVLLEHGADVNTVWYGKTPLEEACAGTYDSPAGTEVAKLLIAHGANVNAVGKDGCTPLQSATAAIKPELAMLLVRNGADVDPTPNCAEPLRWAIQRGQLDLVKLLFEAGSTEVVPDYSVCNQFQADGLHPSCPKEQILALLANPPAPVIKLARIAKEMSGAKAPSAAASPVPDHKSAEPNSDADEPRYHAAERPHDLAVVVGIEKYNGGLPAASYAEHDARAVRKHLLALGYPERNIFLLTGEDATKSGLVKNLETRLPALTKPDSTVFFYYSGHGAPDAETGKAYLLPVDGDPQFLKDTAYPLSRLYAALGKLPAKRVIVALDSCFSGAGGRSVIAKGTRPLIVKIDAGGALPGKIVALTASAGSQTSGTIDAQGHGAFTYYLLRGLNGAAKGDDGTITVQSLYDYLEPNVEDAARRENRDQAPQLLRAGGSRAQRILLR